MLSHSRSASLIHQNSFAIDTTTPDLYCPTSIEEIREIDRAILERCYILGEGSNTLFIGVSAPTILRPLFKGIEVEETDDIYRIKVAAGESWHDFVSFCVKNNYNGLENLALIPGSVGAAPVQNIGAYGVEIADFIESVSWYEIASGELKIMPKSACGFGYRESLFKREFLGKGIITEVILCLPKAWKPKLNYNGLDSLSSEASAKQVFEQVINIRNQKLPNPKDIPNAGSFFKNPVIERKQLVELLKVFPEIVYYDIDDTKVKVAAGWLIDRLGLKGFELDGAAVHNKQALVLVNQGVNSGMHIVKLAKHVQDKVSKAFGILLEPEVRLVDDKGLKEISELND